MRIDQSGVFGTLPVITWAAPPGDGIKKALTSVVRSSTGATAAFGGEAMTVEQRRAVARNILCTKPGRGKAESSGVS